MSSDKKLAQHTATIRRPATARRGSNCEQWRHGSELPYTHAAGWPKPQPNFDTCASAAEPCRQAKSVTSDGVCYDMCQSEGEVMIYCRTAELPEHGTVNIHTYMHVCP